MTRQSITDWSCFLGDNAGNDPAEFYQRCRAIGYTGAEMVPTQRRQAARAAGLKLLNSSGPGMTAGLNRTEHHAVLLPAIVAALEEAESEGIGAVIVFSGNRAGQSDAEGIRHCAAGLRQLLPHCARTGVGLLFEMLNSFDHADYQADHGRYGFVLMDQLGSPAVKLLYDIYHMERMGDDTLADIRAHLPLIGHFHCAAAPDRSSTANSRTADYRSIADMANELGYQGYFGQEFIARKDLLTELERSYRLMN